MKYMKGAMNMTQTLTNMKDILYTYETEFECQTPIIDAITGILKMKRIARAKKDIIEKNTETNKEIRNGRTVIRGTRITPEELLLIMAEVFENEEVRNFEELFENISKQYPSIDSKEQILASILYTAKKQNLLTYIASVIFKK